MFIPFIANNPDCYINVTEGNIHIHNSYKIKKVKDMNKVIDYVKEKCPTAFKTRSRKSVIREWKVHNFLYKLNIQKSRTIHTDIETKQNPILMIGYFLISLISF